MVGSYFSINVPVTNWTVRADFPTPPLPRTTTLYSRIAPLLVDEFKRLSKAITFRATLNSITISLHKCHSQFASHCEYVSRTEPWLCYHCSYVAHKKQSTKTRCPQIDFIVEIPPGRQDIGDCVQTTAISKCIKYLNVKRAVFLSAHLTIGIVKKNKTCSIEYIGNNTGQTVADFTCKPSRALWAYGHSSCPNAVSSVQNTSCVSLFLIHHIFHVPSYLFINTILAAILSGGDPPPPRYEPVPPRLPYHRKEKGLPSHERCAKYPIA